MDHIATVLGKVLRRRGLNLHADAAYIAHEARAWLTNELPAHGRFFEVRSYKDGVLLLACPHSVAAQECQAISHRLLEHLRIQMPKNAFSSIRIVRGEASPEQTRLA
jgi:predicted nucleic acid-binding Zn ribbon protein